MKLIVTFATEGGNKERREVEGEEAAKSAAIELINTVPHLNPGDKITVTEIDEDDGA